MYEIRGSSGSYSQTYRFDTRKEANAYVKAVLKSGWERVTISLVRPMSVYTLTYKIVAMWVREGSKMVNVDRRKKLSTR